MIKIKVILVNSYFDNKTLSSLPKYITNLFSPNKLRMKSEPPLGLLYLAAVLEKNGIEVEIIDNFILKLPSEKLIKKIIDKTPSIVGFSSFSHTYPAAKKNMEDLKKMSPKIPIIFGGPHATLYYSEIIKQPFIDIVVRGEGEYTLLELVKTLSLNKNLKNVRGITFKNNNKIIHNPERPFIKNLDELPFPARDLVNLNQYLREKTNYIDTEPVDFISSSRGCPFGCAFCSSKIIWKKNYRCRSAKNVVDEIEFMIENYGTKGLYFREDNFTIIKKRVIDLCNEIKKRKLNIKWQCESRVDLISKDLIEEMKSAGCQGIWFGIESGSQKILDYLKKGTALKQAEKTIKLCEQYGIKVGASFMIGLPNETKEDIKKSFDFAKKLNADTTWFNQFTGIPKSEIYDEIKMNGNYKYEWEKLLIADFPELSYEEIKKITNLINRYFLFRRLPIILKRQKFSNLPMFFSKIIKN